MYQFHHLFCLIQGHDHLNLSAYCTHGNHMAISMTEARNDKISLYPGTYILHAIEIGYFEG
jgi:hypothetical protein